MNTCQICEKDFVVEDLTSCDRCGKNVCPDCIVGNKLAGDDFENACKTCLEKEII